MEKSVIWYMTDNEHGIKLADAIRTMALPVNIVKTKSTFEANIDNSIINIFIFDLENSESDEIITEIMRDSRLNQCIKFIILHKKDIHDVLARSYNTLHLEFIARPTDKREFLLLLEKSIIVERYREIMKFISKESEERIEAFEGLLDINRKNVFSTNKEKEAFEKIIHYEKNLIREQAKLSTAIKDFTLMRQSDFFELEKRVNAEEMLGDLRRKELIDAHSIIGAQENVIDFSAKELKSAHNFIDASEKVAELSITEQVELHHELERHKELVMSMSDEIDRLIAENDELRTKLTEKK